MRVEISAEAEEDLIDGYHFYEKQEAGLGTYFFRTLSAEINSLHKFGGIHPSLYGSHRALSECFPYAIFIA